MQKNAKGKVKKVAKIKAPKIKPKNSAKNSDKNRDLRCRTSNADVNKSKKEKININSM